MALTCAHAGALAGAHAGALAGAHAFTSARMQVHLQDLCEALFCHDCTSIHHTFVDYMELP